MVCLSLLSLSVSLCRSLSLSLCLSLSLSLSLSLFLSFFQTHLTSVAILNGGVCRRLYSKRINLPWRLHVRRCTAPPCNGERTLVNRPRCIARPLVHEREPMHCLWRERRDVYIHWRTPNYCDCYGASRLLQLIACFATAKLKDPHCTCRPYAQR